MLGFYISLPFLLFAIYRLAIVLINYYTRPFLPVGAPKETPLVSVLVYAQNSEKNIGQLIQDLRNQTYQNLEVLIYNDQSNDKTVDAIAEFSGGDKRFPLFNGNDIQSGWQRKNYAYDKLAQLAKGQYFIFIDENFIPDNQFIANAVSNMQDKNLSLLAIYPKRHSQGFWERIQVSASHWLFFSLVSTKSFLKNRAGEINILDSSLLVFETNTYQLGKWYEKFKGVENPEHSIVLSVKDQNKRFELLLGDNCLTYHHPKGNTTQLVDKFEGLVKTRNWRIVFSIALVVSPFMIVFLMPFPLVFLYFISIIYGQMLISVLCQESVLLKLLLLPVQYTVLSISLIKSNLKK